MEQIYNVIRKLIIEAAELEDDVQIAPTDALDNHDVDSLAGLEVAVNLEKTYQIKIPPARYEEMRNIHAIAVIVQDALDAKAAQVPEAA